MIMKPLNPNLTVRGKWRGILNGSRCQTQGPCWLALAAVAQALLAGCAAGPDYKRPEATTIPTAYAGATNGWKIAEPQGQIP